MKEREVKGVRRKGSEVEDKEKEAEEKSAVQVKEVKGAEEQKKQAVSAPVVKKSLGLVSYGSDSDDDDD